MVILKQTIITISLLSSSLCLGMEQTPSNISLLITTLNEVLSLNKQPISLKTIRKDKDILADFEKKWGYPISNNLIKETIGDKSTYKAVPKTYTNNNPLVKIEIQHINNSPNIISSEKTSSEVKTVNQLHAEEEQLKKMLTEKNVTLLESLNKNKELRDSIQELKKEALRIKKEITSAQNNSIQEEQNTTTKKTKSKKKKKNRTPQQQTVTVKIPKSAISTLPTQLFTEPTVNPTTEDLQKKRNLLKFLFKRYNAKSEGQLKIKLAQECREKKSFGQGSILNGCSWEYLLLTNTLVINTDAFREVKDSWEDID